jgi:adenylate cyclase
MSGTNASDATWRPPDRRKLIAVVYADMVGYSRLIGLDDGGTLERLRALRSTLIDPAIEEHGGRIVQTGGDSLLIVFDSIDGAVRCAVKVQQHIPHHDGDQPRDRAIRFRVGINIGDAIADGTDLHGEAVNVAARIQAECPPGGICVTRAVRDHVHDRLDLAFEELGALTLKNITRPVEAFVLRVGADTPPKSVRQSLAHISPEAIPMPDKPSVAVLAFTNMSADPEQEYFSDGIADDIITELSRSHSLFVIARNSSFSYRGRSVDVKQVARELGVRYVVEGSVRRVAERIRINAHLIDAIAGNQIWAERYDRQLADIFSAQDEITIAVTRAIHPTIADAELRRILRKPPENLGAWEAYQRGLWHLRKPNATDNERARDFFRRATELDPMFATPHAMLAYSRGWGFTSGGVRGSRENQEMAEAESRRAIELDPNDATAHAMLSWWAYTFHGNYSAGLDRADHAISVSPNDISAWVAKGRALVFSGRAGEGRDAIQTALRLSPRDPVTWVALMMLAISYYFERNYIAAVEVAQRTIGAHPAFPLPYRWLAAALGQLGRTDEAHDALRRAIEVSPRSFEFYVRRRPPWHRLEDHEHMLDGLRRAGWMG